MSTHTQNQSGTFIVKVGNEVREFKSLGGVNEYLRTLYDAYVADRNTAHQRVLTLGQALCEIRHFYAYGLWERHLQSLGFHLSTCRYAMRKYQSVSNPSQAEQPNKHPDTIIQNERLSSPDAKNAVANPCHTCGKALDPEQFKGDICKACASRGPTDDPEDDPAFDDDDFVDDGDDAGVGIAGDEEDDEYGDAEELDDEEFEDTVRRLHPPELLKPKTIGEFHKDVLDTLGLAKPEEPAKRNPKPEQLTFEGVYAEAANRLTHCIQGVKAALESGTLSDGARARMEAAFKNISSEIEAAMRECGLAERGA